MSWYWRALVAALIIGGTALWAPVAATNAAGSFVNTGSTAQAPATQDNNDNDDDNSDNAEDNDNDVAEDNDNNQGEDNDNDIPADNGNANDNGEDNDNDGNPTAPGVPTDPGGTGAPVSNANLTVELWKSNERPVVNQPFQIGVTGNGNQMGQVWWWAESPNPNGDDMGALGVQMHECGGAQPCAQNWTVVARSVGWYRIYARVRDISGNEVQTEWYFLVSENTRSG
jgi:hypothetical protein